MYADPLIGSLRSQTHGAVGALVPEAFSVSAPKHRRVSYFGAGALGVFALLLLVSVPKLLTLQTEPVQARRPADHGSAPEINTVQQRRLVARRADEVPGFVRHRRSSSAVSSSAFSSQEESASSLQLSSAVSSVSSLSPAERRKENHRLKGKGVLKNRPVQPMKDAPPIIRADDKVAVYLTAASAGRKDGYLAKVLDESKAVGANAVIIELKGGEVHFQTDAPMALELGLVNPQVDLPSMIETAHQKGMYVMVRFISVKDSLFASKVPAARIKNSKTLQPMSGEWVDPAAPETLEYNRQILEDLVRAGVDEINLDYIRYPTDYSQAAIGLTGAEKAERLEAFIRMARETIDAIHPETKLGISTYAILGWNYPLNMETLGQDFVRFAPYLDVISPMAYPSSFSANGYYVPGKNPGSRSYYLVYRTLTGYADLLGPEQAKKLRPWIQGYYLTPQQIKDEIQAVYDSGNCGFTFWNAWNVYDTVYQGMKLAQPGRPARCQG